MTTALKLIQLILHPMPSPTFDEDAGLANLDSQCFGFGAICHWLQCSADSISTISLQESTETL